MRRVRHSLRPLPPVLLVASVLESSIEVSEWNVRIDMRRRIRRQPNGLQNFMLTCIVAFHPPRFNKFLMVKGQTFRAVTISIMGRRSSSAMPGISRTISSVGAGSATWRSWKPFFISVSR